MNIEELKKYIHVALLEDIGDGDHTSMSTVSDENKGSAYLLCKDTGILAGVEAATYIFDAIDPTLMVSVRIADGSPIKQGDIAFIVEGKDRSILMAERTVLNVMQRMSGVATLTRQYAEALKGFDTKLLDTRKTTPGFRLFEKWGVRIGGGYNHRMGLYDMIMIKDNHIDYAGGVENAINAVHTYLSNAGKNLKIEIECRTFAELETILKLGRIDRIMLDNFTPENATKAIELIDKRFETELSGGINLTTIKDYARCGADFISVGALTHSYTSLDLSLKALS